MIELFQSELKEATNEFLQITDKTLKGLFDTDFTYEVLGPCYIEVSRGSFHVNDLYCKENDTLKISNKFTLHFEIIRKCELILMYY
jgi:hypothetical protein